MATEPFSGNVGQMKAANKWLASEDFIGMKPVSMTINGVFKAAGETMQDGKKKDFFTIGFAETPKQLVLNATNRKTLANAYGAKTKGWIDQKVEVFAQDGVKAIGGGTTTGLRLRALNVAPNPLNTGNGGDQ